MAAAIPMLVQQIPGAAKETMKKMPAFLKGIAVLIIVIVGAFVVIKAFGMFKKGATWIGTEIDEKVNGPTKTLSYKETASKSVGDWFGATLFGHRDTVHVPKK